MDSGEVGRRTGEWHADGGSMDGGGGEVLGLEVDVIGLPRRPSATLLQSIVCVHVNKFR